MGYVSKEYLKENGFMLFQYKKDADGSESVLPVNIDDLEEEGMTDPEINSAIIVEMAKAYFAIMNISSMFVDKYKRDMYIDGVANVLRAAHVEEHIIEQMILKIACTEGSDK